MVYGQLFNAYSIECVVMHYILSMKLCLVVQGQAMVQRCRRTRMGPTLWEHEGQASMCFFL